MTHLDLVQILDAGENLVEKATGLGVLEPALFDDVIKELATGCILHYQEKLFASLNDLIQLHNIRVTHDFQDMNLAHDTSDV